MASAHCSTFSFLAISSPFAVPFGSAGSVRTRADTPHCMSFLNKACFHGDHLSPFLCYFYGSRAHNTSAVSYPIPSSPSSEFLYHNFFLFFFRKAFRKYTYSLSFTSIKSTLYLLRTEHKNMWPLTRIFAPQPVVFFFFFCHRLQRFSFFPPLTFSWNDTFPRGRFSSVAVCGCLSCWNTEISFYMLLYTALLEPLHLSASCSCFTVIFHLLFGY